MTIHPGGRMPDGSYKNTSKPHKGKGKLAKTLANRNARRIAHAAIPLVGRDKVPLRFSAGGYKLPGSMKA